MAEGERNGGEGLCAPAGGRMKNGERIGREVGP